MNFVVKVVKKRSGSVGAEDSEGAAGIAGR